MKSISTVDESEVGRRRRLNRAVKQSLRELGNQLALLNHRVGARLALKDIDLDCLDLIARHGPLSPSTLAQRAGQHPATMTGVIDRLERDGWVARERDPADRRAILIRALPERTTELVQLYAGMNRSMDEICAGFGAAELEIIANFLGRTANAGGAAAAKLATD